MKVWKDSKLVTIFSPKGTLTPYFAEFGWMTKNSNTDVPQNNTIWKLKEGKFWINKPLS